MQLAGNLKKRKENVAFRPFWPCRRPKTPQACRELWKACLGPLQGAPSLARSSPGLPRACPRPPLPCRGTPEGLTRVAHGLPRGSSARELPGSFGPGQPAVATRRLQQIATQLCDIRQCRKMSEHARVHSRRSCPMFRPVAASRSGTRYMFGII